MLATLSDFHRGVGCAFVSLGSGCGLCHFEFCATCYFEVGGTTGPGKGS